MPKIRCPACKARYNVSEAARGKRTTCKQCGQVFKIPESIKPPAEPQEEVLRFADLDALATGRALDVARSQAAHAGAEAALALPTNGAANYAAASEVGGGTEEAARVAFRAYFRSIGRSLAFPRRLGNAATVLIICALLGLGGIALATLPIIGIICFLVAYGCYLSYQLNVVQGAAGGEEELPTLALTEGWVDDIIVPFLKMLTATLLAQLPASVMVFATLVQGGTTSTAAVVAAASVFFGNYEVILGMPDVQSQVVCAALILLGYFVWPMLILILAVSGFSGIHRIDLIAMTIIKSFPAYVVAVLIVYGAMVCQIGVDLAVAKVGIETGLASRSVAPLLLVPVVLLVAEVYMTIIAMRAIGLYYHHFKHRFAWSWG